MRIIGIDVGSHSVKAVEIDSAFGRYEIHDYHEEVVASGSPVAEAVTKLIRSLPKPPDRIVLALRSSQTTFRNLQLPTRDKKAIQASVGFELEDELPFNEDQAVHDFAILSQSKQAGTFVHVSASLKTHLKAALENWHACGLEPDLVTSEGWAYRTLFNKVAATAAANQKPILMAHIGHERTVFYAHWRGNPVLTRELNWGGRDLTLAICQKYNLPVGEAEHAKLERGFVIPPSHRKEATADQIEFSDNLLTAIDAMIFDLRQTELGCKNITRENIGSIYLSGGSSLLPGLAKVIEETLQIPTLPLQALSGVSNSGVTYSEQSDAAFSLATALALCQVGNDRNSMINYRKNEFAKEGHSTELNFALLKKPLLALAITSFCLFLSLIVQSSVYHSRMKDINTQLERSVKSFFGQVSNSAIKTYMSNTSTLKASVNKEIAKQRELSKLFGPNARSPVDALKDLSLNIPRDIVVDMTQFQIGSAPALSYLTASADKGGDTGSMSVTFLVSNPQVAEKLAQIMGGRINNIQRSKMDEVTAPDGNGKRWKITFSGKPMEDIYGK